MHLVTIDFLPACNSIDFETFFITQIVTREFSMPPNSKGRHMILVADVGRKLVILEQLFKPYNHIP